MMDPLIPHMRNVFLFAFLLCLSNFTQASEQTSPENIVYNFYKSYLKEESSDNSRFLSQYVSDELMKSIISLGGNKLDHFDGYLSDYYSKHGFKEYDIFKWDDQYKPIDWDKNDGKPDVILRKL